MWPATCHMFPKLRLKYKPNLISLAGGMTSVPVTNPDQRATPLRPKDWKDMISEAQRLNKPSEEVSSPSASAASAAVRRCRAQIDQNRYTCSKYRCFPAFLRSVSLLCTNVTSAICGSPSGLGHKKVTHAPFL